MSGADRDNVHWLSGPGFALASVRQVLEHTGAVPFPVLVSLQLVLQVGCQVDELGLGQSSFQYQPSRSTAVKVSVALTGYYRHRLQYRGAVDDG